MPGVLGPARRPASWQLGLIGISALVVFVVGIALAVDRTGSSNGRSGTSHPVADGGSATSPAPVPSAPADPDLFTPPAGFTWIPDGTAGTGAITLDQAAKLDGASGLSQASLQQLGFVRGVSRQWVVPAPSSASLVDVVYTFAQSSQAASYAAAVVAARRADPNYAVVTTPPGAPAGSVLFSDTSGNEVIVFASGKHAVLMGLLAGSTAGGPKPDAAQLISLAGAQATTSAVS